MAFSEVHFWGHRFMFHRFTSDCRGQEFSVLLVAAPSCDVICLRKVLTITIRSVLSNERRRVTWESGPDVVAHQNNRCQTFSQPLNIFAPFQFGQKTTPVQSVWFTARPWQKRHQHTPLSINSPDNDLLCSPTGLINHCSDISQADDHHIITWECSLFCWALIWDFQNVS